MNPNVTENLVCPVCKGRLGWNAESEEFLCTACGLAFAVRDGIPDMIAHDAREMTEEELEELRLKEKKAEASAAWL